MFWSQLSLFSDKEVERNPLCRCFLNPNKNIILRFRMEVLYKVDNPINSIDKFEIWNIKRHINGIHPIKIGRRYFYENKSPINL